MQPIFADKLKKQLKVLESQHIKDYNQIQLLEEAVNFHKDNYNKLNIEKLTLSDTLEASKAEYSYFTEQLNLAKNEAEKLQKKLDYKSKECITLANELKSLKKENENEKKFFESEHQKEVGELKLKLNIWIKEEVFRNSESEKKIQALQQDYEFKYKNSENSKIFELENLKEKLKEKEDENKATMIKVNKSFELLEEKTSLIVQDLELEIAHLKSKCESETVFRLERERLFEEELMVKEAEKQHYLSEMETLKTKLKLTEEQLEVNNVRVVDLNEKFDLLKTENEIKIKSLEKTCSSLESEKKILEQKFDKMIKRDDLKIQKQQSIALNLKEKCEILINTNKLLLNEKLQLGLKLKMETAMNSNEVTKYKYKYCTLNNNLLSLNSELKEESSKLRNNNLTLQQRLSFNNKLLNDLKDLKKDCLSLKEQKKLIKAV
ncbi:hypothetical protein HK099_004669 [Clydaea vesicula]|uniref:Uncharacterized protein n=1 Tax=Clydaea vesicula TaxID=447962 RepID=A0AAD5U237_9FUNG|nr:hypothetical protein HK099_004669 [Clydaea vesicula]KAJ3390317.1 hypothetical protein HDU92_000556 [Lobulomyces angularis]